MMPKQTQELRSRIYHFLEDRILAKPEEDRTKLEDLVVETGRAFADALLRFCHDPSIAAKIGGNEDKDMTTLLRAYNEINRRDVDIDVIKTIRTPVK